MKPDALAVAGQSAPKNYRTSGQQPASRSKTGSGTRGKQVLLSDLQRLRQKDDLCVSHATDLRLDFGNRVFANVPTCARTTRRQHGLCPALAVADFAHNGTDNVLRNGFAHDFALTVCERGLVFIPISEGMNHRPVFRVLAAGSES